MHTYNTDGHILPLCLSAYNTHFSVNMDICFPCYSLTGEILVAVSGLQSELLRCVMPSLPTCTYISVGLELGRGDVYVDVSRANVYVRRKVWIRTVRGFVM